MNEALILVDIQNDYFEGGKNELHQTEQAARNARLALDRFREGGLPVFHIRHISDYPGATFFLPGTPGSEIHESVAPQEWEPILIKHAPSAFLHTGLAEALAGQGVGHLVICGMMSHMCIDTTVRAAMDHGFSATVLEDACTTMDLIWNGAVIPAEAVHATFMAALDGVFARVITTEAYLSGARK